MKQEQPLSVRRDDMDDILQEKNHRKTPHQKQSSHSCNPSSRGNCELIPFLFSMLHNLKLFSYCVI